MTVALVTGASRGLGLEVARQLAGRGWRVIAGVRNIAAAEQRLEDVAGIELRPLDVTDASSVSALRRETDELDVLVNNAGILYDSWQTPMSVDLSVVSDAFETNVLGVWRMCIAFADLIRRSEHGRIVNVSAGAGTIGRLVDPGDEVPAGHTPAYSVSKAALNALTLMLAAEFTEHGVLVNAVIPGWLATDLGGPGGGPVSEGAQRVVSVTTLPDDGPTGALFCDGQVVAW
jgi:NAD(P)-dependent dehydrogenase (short-subunit alcohol dehydrogenase family)